MKFTLYGKIVRDTIIGVKKKNQLVEKEKKSKKTPRHLLYYSKMGDNILISKYSFQNT